MGKKKLTAAVVGLGNIGLGYDLVHGNDYVQTHTKAFLADDGFELLFGVDPDSAKRSTFERFTKRPSYGSLTDAGKNFPSVDVISLCVGLNERPALWDMIASVQPKVVILEKPLGKSLTDGKQIVAWAAKNDISLFVNYIRRVEQSTQKLKTLLESKQYGALTGIDIRYNGGFFNNASHYIDMMLFLLGRPNKVWHLEKRKDGQDLRVDFCLQYPSFKVYGNYACVDCPVGELIFWCEKAQICYRKFGQEIEILTPQKDPVFRKFKELAHHRTMKTTMPYAMAHVVEHVRRAYHGKERLLSDGRSACETLEICEHVLLNG
ncbi:MAG: Gfo/Idh/MocA family oxidoreductase [Candidatus Omnitrophica bacterium]|nr:Gfo/Idh/MocA family oxidoreductase [Candidatus Omnitrophota bacterium]